MARLRPHQGEDLDSLFAALDSLSRSPLSAISAQLRPLVEEAKSSSDSGTCSPSSFRELVKYCCALATRLPQTFGIRFGFDAALIAAITEETGKLAAFSGMVIPRPDHGWGHETLMMPSEGGSCHVIDLILMPGSDEIRDIDLLSYPWIGHELAHNLLFRHDQTFRETVSACLEKEVRRLKLGGMSDKGSADAKSRRLIDEVVQFWTPTPDHKNWPHEIAADLFALWIFGPAYLASFEDVLEDKTLNPYHLTQSHPPYALRTDALLIGAEVLGWKGLTGTLSKHLGDWTRSNWRASKTNRFRALSNSDLTKECVNATLSTCRELAIPRCTPAVLDTASSSVQDEQFEFGTRLLLQAYSVFRQRGQSGYLSWQSTTVQALAKTVTL